jgi:uncharacterized protein YdeI (YjbR/CyaY-like superfamily)
MSTKSKDPKNPMNPSVDVFLEEETKWREVFTKLRKIALASGLTEEFKWGVPCYALEGKNVFLIHGFKEYCAILFVKGALLPDPKGILVQQTANVQAARQVRFTKASEVDELEPVLKTYIREAIAIEKAGKEVVLKDVDEYPIPDELKARFAKDPALKKAFRALTPGRQRAYLLHFSQAKQAATREARIDKYVPKILAGKGMDD